METKNTEPYDGPILVLKTTKAGGEPHCNGRGGISTAFRWPRSGVVTCDDWQPTQECGHGFHGLEFGEGDWSLLCADDTPSDEWRVVLVQPENLIRLNDNGQTKVKFSTGEIVYCGDMAGAMTYVICGKEAMTRAIALAGSYYSKAASSGDYSTAASSGNYSTAASSGDYSKAASSGYYSTAASSGDSSKAASSGDYSKAASSGYYSTAASSGNYSTAEQKGKSGIAAAIGGNVMAKAGENGLLILTWWDEGAKRYRAVVGEVGIDGIEADTWYAVVGGKLAKAD